MNPICARFGHTWVFKHTPEGQALVCSTCKTKEIDE